MDGIPGYMVPYIENMLALVDEIEEQIDMRKGDIGTLCFVLMSQIMALKAIKHGYYGSPDPTVPIGIDLLSAADYAMADLARRFTESN